LQRPFALHGICITLHNLRAAASRVTIGKLLTESLLLAWLLLSLAVLYCLSRLRHNTPCLQSGAAAAPNPTDASVFINNVPAMDVYVISFGGWANEATYKQQAAKLMQKLKDEKLPFDSRWVCDGSKTAAVLCNHLYRVVGVLKLA
jgi:hypothetical protein